MNWIDYREKLMIGFDDQEKTSYFLCKIFNILDSASESRRNQIDENEYFIYCNTTGTVMRQGQLYGDGYDLIVKNLRHHSQSLEDFLSHYIAFINCQKDKSYKEYTQENYKNVVCNMLTESHIPFDLIQDSDGYFIFPKGVPAFDDALVSAPLQWLSAYPKAEKAWSKALREYSEGNRKNASDVADLFRKALETFFQEFFKSEKSLENLKSQYGDYLKGKGVPKEIKSNFEALLQAYANYMNNYAKHKDATSDKVLEYLMYQTGNIMRLLITL